jgi:hypothetical protein
LVIFFSTFVPIILNLRMEKKIIVILFLCFSVLSYESSLLAQSDSLPAISTSANVDFFSRYIWRGQEYGHAPSIQPGLSATWEEFTLGGWGAYKFTGTGTQETDFYLSKTLSHFTFSIWDYWSFSDTSSMDFFNYNHKTTAHILETMVMISGGENLPFNLLGSYFFYGADTSRSIYLELQYLYSSGLTDLQVFAGFQPKGTYYGSAVGFVNLGCTIIKKIEVTGKWSLPLSLSLIINPNCKTAYIVAGITF